jgi:hypothetical protein
LAVDPVGGALNYVIALLLPPIGRMLEMLLKLVNPIFSQAGVKTVKKTLEQQLEEAIREEAGK